MIGRRRQTRSNVKVSGCGCCLPIPLGVLSLTALGLRAAVMHVRST